MGGDIKHILQYISQHVICLIKRKIFCIDETLITRYPTVPSFYITKQILVQSKVITCHGCMHVQRHYNNSAFMGCDL